MASTEILRLMKNLRVQLPGAIDDAIKLEVYNALNDFFQGSNIWREDLSVAITAGDKSYTLTPTQTSNIVRLIGVENSDKLPVSATLDLITQELVLELEPSTNDTYTVQVVLTVNDPVDAEDYPEAPDWVINLYMNDIISGVLGRMMAQPAKPYSNAALAVVHTRSFQAATAVARAEANRRFTFGAQRWRFPQSFNRYKARR